MLVRRPLFCATVVVNSRPLVVFFASVRWSWLLAVWAGVAVGKVCSRTGQPCSRSTRGNFAVHRTSRQSLDCLRVRVLANLPPSETGPLGCGPVREHALPSRVFGRWPRRLCEPIARPTPSVCGASRVPGLGDVKARPSAARYCVGGIPPSCLACA